MNIHAATLHSLEDFLTLFSFYSQGTYILRIVVTVLLLLQVFRYFFVHINFVNLSIYSGGEGKTLHLLRWLGNKRVSTKIDLYKLKKILQNLENLKLA